MLVAFTSMTLPIYFAYLLMSHWVAVKLGIEPARGTKMAFWWFSIKRFARWIAVIHMAASIADNSITHDWVGLVLNAITVVFLYMIIRDDEDGDDDIWSRMWRGVKRGLSALTPRITTASVMS